MSTLYPLPDLDLPQLSAADELNPQVAEQVERVDTVALSVIENAVRMAENLHSSIKRGRNSSSALRCTNMVDDFCLGMADLNGLVLAMQAGDMSAAAKIPALLKAFKESLQYSKLLEGNKGYKKDGEKVMAGYIYETIDTLSSQFDQVCDAVRPLSEAIEVEMVRMTVRNELNTVADFKFNTDGVIKTFGKPAAVAEAAPFNKEETTWFESEAVPTSAPTQARKGFLSRVMSTLGDVANSVKRTLPRATLAGAILSAGCGEEEVAPAPAPMTFPSAPSVAAPAPVAPAPKFQVDENAPNLWKAISGELFAECGLNGGHLQRETGKLVRESFATQNSGYKALAKGMSDERQEAAKAHLSSSYGITFADTTDGIFKSMVQTGNLGAVNMQNGELGEITLWANAALEDYACPVK